MARVSRIISVNLLFIEVERITAIPSMRKLSEVTNLICGKKGPSCFRALMPVIHPVSVIAPTISAMQAKPLERSKKRLSWSGLEKKVLGLINSRFIL